MPEPPRPVGAGRYGITTTWVFDAPCERMWREWAEPVGWFGGPESDVPFASVSMDIEPGGRWRATMFDDRTQMPFEQRGHLRPEQHERTRQGWACFFDRIAGRLTNA